MYTSSWERSWTIWKSQHLVKESGQWTAWRGCGAWEHPFQQVGVADQDEDSIFWGFWGRDSHEENASALPGPCEVSYDVVSWLCLYYKIIIYCSCWKRKQKHGLVGAAPKTEKELVDHGVPRSSEKPCLEKHSSGSFIIFCLRYKQCVQYPQGDPKVLPIPMNYYISVCYPYILFWLLLSPMYVQLLEMFSTDCKFSFF